jgi:cell division septal protein FtsQ
VSDPGHDPLPDRAALDELARAFGLDDGPAPDAGAPTPGPARRAGDRAPDRPTGDEQPPDGRDAPVGDDLVGDDLLNDDLVSDEDRPGDGDADLPPTGLIELVLAEEPVDPPEPTPDALTQPPRPRIIRIDDITGAVGDVTDARVPGEPVVDEVRPPSVDGPGGADGGAPPAVIAIGADDLPDAVYITGSLESGVPGPIVFIDDDASGDVVQPEVERDLRRGIEPRMRERRLQVRRAQSRKRLKWVVLGLVLVVAGIGALAVFGSGLFAVQEDELEIVGAVYTDPARLADIGDELVGTPTLRVDTQRIERELESIPWVADAKVTVRFPHSATIEIREREAIVTYQGPDRRFRVLDREGRVLDVLDKWPIAYVLVTGPDPADLEPGQFAPQGYVGAAELAKNLTGSVRGQVEHIEVTADGQRLTMLLTDGTEVRFGDYRNLFTKLVRLETRLADPDREPGPIDVATG